MDDDTPGPSSVPAITGIVTLIQMQPKDRNKRKIHCTKASKAEICADKLFNIGHPLKHSVFLPQLWVVLPQLDTLPHWCYMLFMGTGGQGSPTLGNKLCRGGISQPHYFQTLEMGQSFPAKLTFWVNSLFLQQQSLGKPDKYTRVHMRLLKTN